MNDVQERGRYENKNNKISDKSVKNKILKFTLEFGLERYRAWGEGRRREESRW